MISKSAVRKLWARITPTFYEMEGARLDALFTLLLIVFVSILLIDVPQYREDTRVFPLVIGLPLIVMLIVLLSVQLSDTVNNYAKNLIELFVSENELQVTSSASKPGHGEIDQRTRRSRAVRSTSWVLSLFLLITLFGFLPAIFVFLILYFRYYASQDLRRSAAYASLTWLFIYVLFSLVLRTRFYQGLLWSQLT